MDFVGLPPEVNSARMYSGPGSGSLISSADAWLALATDLESGASSYRGVLQSVAAAWVGPSSDLMAAALAPYIAWLDVTAQQAAMTGHQSMSAAVAYETAFAATVPPPVIAANRAQLAALVATNIFGQNTPAIAATEAQYGEMWAQDAAAMVGYHASAQAATAALPTFQSPFSAINPNTGWLGLFNLYMEAFVSSAPVTDVTAIVQLLTLLTLTREFAPGGPIAHAVAAVPSVSARVGDVRARANAGARIGRLTAPPSWGQSRTALGSRPRGGRRFPVSAATDDSVPLVPAIPLGRSDQRRRARPDPEYGHVSKVVPAPHPAGG